MSTDRTKAKSQAPVFGFLDRKVDIEKTSGDLPHWFQAGAAMFVTFRTADSMPVEVIEKFHQELKLWLKQNDLPDKLANPPQRSDKVAAVVPNCQQQDAIGTIAATDSVPPAKLAELKKLRARLWQRSLDQCRGGCLLKQPKLARIVADSLLYHDSSKYDLDCFVIMPNHVHAIVQFRPGASLKTVSQSWLRYTARQINFETGYKGKFWQREPFDHIIRSDDQFSYLQTYIADNPTKANLQDGEYLYWRRDIENLKEDSFGPTESKSK